MNNRRSVYWIILGVMSIIVLLSVSACNMPTPTPSGPATPQPTPTVTPSIQAVNVGCSSDELAAAIDTANANPTVLFTLVLEQQCSYELSPLVYHSYPDGLRIRLPIITGRIEVKGNDSVLKISSGGGRIMHINTAGYVRIHNLGFTGGDTRVSGSRGGAIYNSGTLVIENCTFENNRAVNFGGAIYNDLGMLIIQGSTFANNHAVNGGALSFDFGNPGEDHGEIQIADSKFHHNISDSDGGAIYTANGYPAKPGIKISNSIFSDNRADRYGGALRHGSNVVTQIRDCTFEGNHARKGGAILSKAAHEALYLVQSTLSDNQASEVGGAIYNLNILKLENCTLSGNMLGDSTGGAGIHTEGGTIDIKFSTLAENSGVGLYALGSSSPFTAVVENSIIADNQGGDCDGASIASLNAAGDNLDSDASCPGFTFNEDPDLLPLTDNGGPTQTHALLPSSPAADIVDPGTCLPNDQRGESRPKGLLCDLGAFELEYVSLPETESLVPTILELSACREGPGEPYPNISSLQPGSEVQILGIGEDTDYLIINNSVYQRPCWVLKDKVDLNGLDPDTLQVYRIPPLPEQPQPEPDTPAQQSQTGCLVPLMSSPGKTKCVDPCPDTDKYPQVCTP